MTIDCLDIQAMTLAAKPIGPLNSPAPLPTPDEILATIKGLKARARAIAKRKLHGPTQPGAHFEIAMRRIADAQAFYTRNPSVAEQCCWEAQHHLNHCE